MSPIQAVVSACAEQKRDVHMNISREESSSACDLRDALWTAPQST